MFKFGDKRALASRHSISTFFLVNTKHRIAVKLREQKETSRNMLLKKTKNEALHKRVVQVCRIFSLQLVYRTTTARGRIKSLYFSKI